MSDNLESSQLQVERDTLCIHCGYNVRGLHVDGKCPECGTDVEQSLRGDLLQHADAHWLEQLRFGVKLKLWNIVLGFIGGVIGSIIAAITISAGTFSAATLSIVTTLVWLASGGLGLWATFLITEQEPRIGLTEDPVTLRKSVRSCAMFSLFGGMISLSRDAQTLGIIFTLVTWIAALAGYATSIGELVYLRRFAIRIPDENLALSTKRFMTIGIFVVVLIFAVGMFIAVASGITSLGVTAAAPSGSTLLLYLGCFSMVAMLVLFLWYIRLLTKYKDAFEVAAGVARGDASE